MAGGKIRVVQYGLGSIGQEVVRCMLRKEGLELVGIVDSDPEKAGKDAAELLGLDRLPGVTVSADAEAVLRAARPDVVLHTTTSRLAEVSPQLLAAIDAGANVISSTEELFHPPLRSPEPAREIDRRARERGVTVLGTGVNPGFVMDRLAVALTGVCQDVRAIRATRVVDVATRRLPLQRKVGVGLSPQVFEREVQEARLGHVGLLESLVWVATALGWTLDAIQETTEPVLADASRETGLQRVEKGQVLGVRQVARGLRRGEEVITLELQMYAGAPDPQDSILIDGTPPVDLTLRGGIRGDEATVALLINAIPQVIEARPGLLSARDLPLPRIFLNYV